MKSLPLSIFFLFLCSCASINNDPLKQAGVGLIFRHGVDAFIQKDPDPADRAAKILRYAGIAQQVLNSDLTSLDQLDQFLINQLPKDDMLPGDYADAALIIHGAVRAIQDQVKDLPEADQLGDAVVSANYFLDIAIQTAKVYVED